MHRSLDRERMIGKKHTTTKLTEKVERKKLKQNKDKSKMQSNRRMRKTING